MADARQFAIPLVTILLALALLHGYWALGGKWGTAYTVPTTVNGRRAFNPSPLATWGVCGLLTLAAVVVVGKAGMLGGGPFSKVFDIGTWGLVVVFALRTVGNFRNFGFFKTLKGTPFADWDTWLYSPLCLVIVLLALALIMFRRA